MLVEDMGVQVAAVIGIWMRAKWNTKVARIESYIRFVLLR